MKVKVTDAHDSLVGELVGVSAELTEVFCGIFIHTEDGHRFGIAQRDFGLEIICPDRAVINVQVDEHGKTFVTRNGKPVAFDDPDKQKDD